ncbi:hypothetical protein EYF80_048020 [Liparis tanakae]|uniref:Uncharacterized protein n=1 Tax=Liparis tanakae TaxID=230148 RepID=A0A4Z2FKX5_9TELE|nr:hypothetical protein EYF80_048020 [Liparis tanakae]
MSKDNYLLKPPGAVDMGEADETEEKKIKGAAFHHNNTTKITKCIGVEHNITPDIERDIAYDIGPDIAYDIECDIAYDIELDIAFDIERDIAYDIGRDIAYDIVYDIGQDIGRNIAYDIGHDIGPILQADSKCPLATTLDSQPTLGRSDANG